MTQQTAQPMPQDSAQQQINQAAQSTVPPQPNLSFNQQSLPDICKNCRNIVLPNFKFCPNCGNPLNEQADSVSVGRQIYVYLMSALLPPTGLFWGIKYLTKKNQKTKIVGLVAILITVVSVVLSYQVLIGIFKQVQQQLGSYQLLNNAGLPNQQFQNPQNSLSQ